MRILLVEDDVILRSTLVQSLKQQQHVVDAVADGQSGQKYAETASYDLILLDIQLPKIDGITLCQQLRSQGCTTPILLMTGNDTATLRIRGLDAGADDYLTKPLNLDELHARIRALSRRGEVLPAMQLEIGPLRIDPVSCQAAYGDRLLGLTPKEYALLELFMRNPSRIFSRGHILDRLWTFDDPPAEDTVKAHIKGLRRKLKQAGAEDWIENLHGLGYRLDPKLNSVPPSPEAAAMTAAAPSPLNPTLERLWQQHQGLVVQRLEALQQAAAAVESAALTEPLRQAAIQAAHLLTGMLGMFERDAGTELARSIENQLEQQTALNELPALVQKLEALLELAPADCQPDTGGRSPVYAAETKVLAVDDDVMVLGALRGLLEPWGIQVIELSDPRQFWQTLHAAAPDLLILDVEMPELNGIQLCQAMRADPAWQEIPILFLSAHRDLDTIQQGFAAGADDYVMKPIIGVELLTRLLNRLERMRLLKSFSSKDPLTGLLNQPQSAREFEQLLQQADRDGVSFCLAVVALANLTGINRQFGHAAGYAALQRWSQLLRSPFDRAVLGYWGNGEFVVGLLGASPQVLADRLAELKRSLTGQLLTAETAEPVEMICQIGMAEFPTAGLTLQSLYAAASSHFSG